jgi:hypothetical protein
MDRPGSSGEGPLSKGLGTNSSTILRHQPSPNRAAGYANGISTSGIAAAGHGLPANGSSIGRPIPLGALPLVGISPRGQRSRTPRQLGPGRPAWKGHQGAYSILCRLPARQLLYCGLLLLLLLPLGFLVQVHIWPGGPSGAFLPTVLQRSSHSWAGLGRLLPGSSSSSSSSSGSSNDAELLNPAAAASEAEGATFLAGLDDAHCIPPSR